MNTKAQAVMRAVSERLIAMIVEGEADPHAWKQSWKSMGFAFGGAWNVTTKKPYRGGNVMALAFSGHVGPWATYKQWRSIDCQVRKDEKGTVILIPKPFEKMGDDGKVRRGMFFGTASVHASDQVDGYKSAETDESESFPQETLGFDWLERVVKHGDVNVNVGDPAYSPPLDTVFMPPSQVFDSGEQYVSVHAHELTHWTGHSSRLDRSIINAFGSENYALEELVAELGSAMVCGRLGVESEPREDHAHYLANWAARCKADEKVLWNAAKQASAAVEFLFDLADNNKETVQ